MNEDNTDIAKLINIYSIFILIFFLIIFGLTLVSFKEIEEVNEQFNNIKQLKQDNSLIEVNGKIIDADDYYQVDWKSYTPAKDSIE